MKARRMSLRLAVALFSLDCLVVPPHAATPADSPKTAANVVAEITLDAAQPPPKPFLDVTLDVVFTDPAGAQKTVQAYWAGGNQWKVRYSSPVVGTHPDRTQCNETGDTGLHAVEGRVEVTPYTGDNPFFKHGPPAVGKGGHIFLTNLLTHTAKVDYPLVNDHNIYTYCS